MTTDNPGIGRSAYPALLPGAMVLLLIVPQVLFAGELAVNALWPECEDLGLFSFLQWFDPTFFAYNAVLLVVAVSAVPGITYFYVTHMKKEKLRRLRNDLNEKRWEENEKAIVQYVTAQFKMSNYMGSMLTLTLVVLLGASIILLLKPVPSQGAAYGCGVDYSIGINTLLLGTNLEYFAIDTTKYYHHVLVSLTAFQFGFLGAYVYLIGDVVRSYFTLDLSPRTFVASTIRVMTGSMLALVVSFVTAYTLPVLDVAQPAIAFFIGHFPETALVYLEQFVTSKLGIAMKKAQAIALSKLPGMSYLHEMRLMREGYDNVQNLANARPFDLVLLTGFSYRQVRQWVAQAWLCAHLGEQDYEDFCNCTGITSADELAQYLDPNTPSGQGNPEAYLSAATQERYAHKISVLCALVGAWRDRTDRALIV